MGTQIPLKFGLAFMAVATPLIFWDAHRTLAKIESLDEPEQRKARCVERTAQLSLPDGKREAMCDCIVNEMEKRGGRLPNGDYDKDMLTTTIALCYQVNLNQ